MNMKRLNKKLSAGDHHRRAYVGPPHQYDFMGATQFCLLASLGLREHHTVLDFGCGSLRAGRLLLPYLKPGNYFGIDPNKWLIEAAIGELGAEFVDLREPHFNYNSDFEFGVFGVRFDFIVMQSILSHAGSDLLYAALTNARVAMKTSSVLLLTVIHPEQNPGIPSGVEFKGWRYPGCVSYPSGYFSENVERLGYAAQRLPWFHPRQTWWLLTLSDSGLLSESELSALSGYSIQNEVE